MKSDDNESLDVDEAVDIDLPDVDMDPFSGIKPFLLSAIPLLLLFLLKVLLKVCWKIFIVFSSLRNMSKMVFLFLASCSLHSVSTQL